MESDLDSLLGKPPKVRGTKRGRATSKKGAPSKFAKVAEGSSPLKPISNNPKPQTPDSTDVVGGTTPATSMTITIKPPVTMPPPLVKSPSPPPCLVPAEDKGKNVVPPSAPMPVGAPTLTIVRQFVTSPHMREYPLASEAGTLEVDLCSDLLSRAGQSCNNLDADVWRFLRGENPTHLVDQTMELGVSTLLSILRQSSLFSSRMAAAETLVYDTNQARIHAEDDLKEAKGAQDKLEDALRVSQDKLASSEADIDNLKAKLDTKTADFDVAKAEIDRLNTETSAAKAKAERLREEKNSAFEIPEYEKKHMLEELKAKKD
ncbi:uncharacterized protein LOC133789693 [Humulus lupulus]|uniref:uncharacterized protein LOC133789693 n=1 Tax=Humulus lupulus TaxID=3486 RepID=UPI002B402EBC|nr:uncharacterized protein LOC133789693 [Humulus lupulus]